MNIMDVMYYGHQTVLQTVNDLSDDEWSMVGACGHWSIKDIVAHLAAYEQLLVEVLQSLDDPDATTPTLSYMIDDPVAFNDAEVTARHEQTAPATLDEYKAAYEQVMAALEQLSEATLRTNGLLAWYGEAYDLEDFLIYTFYGHKREHCAQIATLLDQQ